MIVHFPTTGSMAQNEIFQDRRVDRMHELANAVEDEDCMGLPLEYKQLYGILAYISQYITPSEYFDEIFTSQPIEGQSLEQQVSYAIDFEDTTTCHCYAKQIAADRIAGEAMIMKSNWPERATQLVGKTYLAYWSFLDTEMATMMDIHIGSISETDRELYQHVHLVNYNLLRYCHLKLFQAPAKPANCKYPVKYSTPSPSPEPSPSESEP